MNTRSVKISGEWEYVSFLDSYDVAYQARVPMTEQHQMWVTSHVMAAIAARQNFWHEIDQDCCDRFLEDGTWEGQRAWRMICESGDHEEVFVLSSEEGLYNLMILGWEWDVLSDDDNVITLVRERV